MTAKGSFALKNAVFLIRGKFLPVSKPKLLHRYMLIVGSLRLKTNEICDTAGQRGTHRDRWRQGTVRQYKSSSSVSTTSLSKATMLLRVYLISILPCVFQRNMYVIPSLCCDPCFYLHLYIILWKLSQAFQTQQLCSAVFLLGLSIYTLFIGTRLLQTRKYIASD